MGKQKDFRKVHHAMNKKNAKKTDKAQKISKPIQVCWSIKNAEKLVKIELESAVQNKRMEKATQKSLERYPLLARAVYLGCERAVDDILEAGEDANIQTPDGLTPLLVAADRGHSAIVQKLLKKGADPTALREDGMNALMISVYKNDNKTFSILWNYMDKANKWELNHSNSDGYTLLTLAAERGYTDFAKFFLSLSGIQLDWQTKEGRSALMMAVASGHKGVIRRLLAAGADVLLEEKRGATALCLAMARGQSDGIHLLLRHLDDKAREAYVKRRVDLLSIPKLDIREEAARFCRDVLFRVILEIRKSVPEGVDMLHKYGVFYSLVRCAETHRRDGETLRCLFHLAACLMYDKANYSRYILDDMADHYVRAKGPDLSLQVMSVYRSKSSFDLRGAAFLPVQACSESFLGQAWLREHYAKIHTHLGEFKSILPVMTFWEDGEGIKSRVIFDRFVEVMQKIGNEAEIQRGLATASHTIDIEDLAMEQRSECSFSVCSDDLSTKWSLLSSPRTLAPCPSPGETKSRRGKDSKGARLQTKLAEKNKLRQVSQMASVRYHCPTYPTESSSESQILQTGYADALKKNLGNKIFPKERIPETGGDTKDLNYKQTILSLRSRTAHEHELSLEQRPYRSFEDLSGLRDSQAQQMSVSEAKRSEGLPSRSASQCRSPLKRGDQTQLQDLYDLWLKVSLMVDPIKLMTFLVQLYYSNATVSHIKTPVSQTLNICKRNTSETGGGELLLSFADGDLRPDFPESLDSKKIQGATPVSQISDEKASGADSSSDFNLSLENLSLASSDLENNNSTDSVKTGERPFAGPVQNKPKRNDKLKTKECRIDGRDRGKRTGHPPRLKVVDAIRLSVASLQSNKEIAAKSGRTQQESIKVKEDKCQVNDVGEILKSTSLEACSFKKMNSISKEIILEPKSHHPVLECFETSNKGKKRIHEYDSTGNFLLYLGENAVDQRVPEDSFPNYSREKIVWRNRCCDVSLLFCPPPKSNTQALFFYENFEISVTEERNIHGLKTILLTDYSSASLAPPVAGFQNFTVRDCSRIKTVKSIVLDDNALFLRSRLAFEILQCGKIKKNSKSVSARRVHAITFEALHSSPIPSKFKRENLQNCLLFYHRMVIHKYFLQDSCLLRNIPQRNSLTFPRVTDTDLPKKMIPSKSSGGNASCKPCETADIGRLVDEFSKLCLGGEDLNCDKKPLRSSIRARRKSVREKIRRTRDAKITTRRVNDGESTTRRLWNDYSFRAFIPTFIDCETGSRWHSVLSGMQTCIPLAQYLKEAPEFLRVGSPRTLCEVNSAAGQVVFSSKSEHTLKEGRYGSYVGLLQNGSPVVVRKIRTVTVSIHEAAILLSKKRTLRHRNIATFYDCVVNPLDCSVYTVTELCEHRLPEYLRIRKELEESSSGKSWVPVERLLVVDLVEALRYLHGMHIVHGFLKPSNVLVTMEERLKLTDCFLLGVQPLTCGIQGTDLTSNAIGTRLSEWCWRPAEVISAGSEEEANVTAASDIQMAGMLIYCILSGGRHPFGCSDRECQENVQAGSPFLGCEPPDTEARELIQDMIRREPRDRPVLLTVTKHPYFWDVDKRFRFLLEVARRIEFYIRKPSKVAGSLQISCLEARDWTCYVHRYLMRYVSESTNKVYQNDFVDLLLFSIALQENFDIMPLFLKTVVDRPSRYILLSFPTIFMSVFYVVKSSQQLQRQLGLQMYF